jgi:HAD superfamily hydrolase (TIGR01484 family)
MQTSTNTRILLCSDLDRTILPNGSQPESPQARPLLHALAAREDVTLAYVSGRDITLLQQAIEEYRIPLPDFAIGDVGSTIYRIDGEQWQTWTIWQDAIAPDWQGLQPQKLAAQLEDIATLRLQEAEKQHRFKLSYYTPERIDVDALLADIDARLQRLDVRAATIWSVDRAAGSGLLDILPASATKIGAIRFLIEHAGFTRQQTVFAGDSGNDLPALVSDIPAVLVRNADEHVRSEIAVRHEGRPCETLYQARGDFLGMNGNYSAGVLEGVVHYHPHLRPWLEAEAASLAAGHDHL